MMANKHLLLHDLLQEDQEPFLLKNYIADRCSQLKRPLSKNHDLQLKKRKPISQNSNFPSNFCKNACFLSFHDSPDVRKSPLFDFPSPAAAKSPSCKSPNTIFLHIPARTATLLLEAALRIQKHSSSSSSKPKTQNKNASFGLFGSLLKRLTHRKNRTRKREIGGDDGVRISVKDILRWDSSVARRKFSEKVEENLVGLEKRSASEVGFSCSCNGRLSSAVWSECNEEKSLDLETSSSSSNSVDSEEIEFVSKERENGFCKSPFHFVLQKSPSSSGCRTPDFSSPATSPCRHNKEEKDNYEGENLKNFQVVEEEEEEEEEEKEQCSPVSVLDPPFEDDDEDDRHEDDDEDDGDGGFDIECSYAIVQRAKQQLLQKLRRFEKLAGLTPTELEKRLLEEEEQSDDEELEEQVVECENDDDEEESISSNSTKNVDEFVREILSKSSFHNVWRIPADMRKLVSDLIAEEERGFDDKEVVAKRVCKRLESWREVESNTIDMMVEVDFRREHDGWKKNKEQVGETAMEIELAIFGLLVEELSQD